VASTTTAHKIWSFTRATTPPSHMVSVRSIPVALVPTRHKLWMTKGKLKEKLLGRWSVVGGWMMNCVEWWSTKSNQIIVLTLLIHLIACEWIPFVEWMPWPRCLVFTSDRSRAQPGGSWELLIKAREETGWRTQTHHTLMWWSSYGVESTAARSTDFHLQVRVSVSKSNGW